MTQILWSLTIIAKKQRKFCQFNLLNGKQCTEATYNIQHTNVNARVHVRAKAKRIKAFRWEAYAKKEQKIGFQGSVKYRHVDRTVWIQNTMPLLVTLDPLEFKTHIQNLTGTNNKIVNNLNYNKKFYISISSLLSRTIRTISKPFYCL